MLTQIYSDVTGREMNIAKSTQTGCLGSAMHAAVAAGYYRDIKEAAKYMSHLKNKKFIPDKDNVIIYNKLSARPCDRGWPVFSSKRIIPKIIRIQIQGTRDLYQCPKK